MGFPYRSACLQVRVSPNAASYQRTETVVGVVENALTDICQKAHPGGLEFLVWALPPFEGADTLSELPHMRVGNSVFSQ